MLINCAIGDSPQLHNSEGAIHMKTLYFDCSSGISGNMTLGALLEIVGDDNYLLEELKKIKCRWIQNRDIKKN